MENKKTGKRQSHPIRFLAGLLAAMLLCGCSADSQGSVPQGAASGTGGAGSPVMGRYVEEEIPVKVKNYSPIGLFPTEDGVYLARTQGMDELLTVEDGRANARKLPVSSALEQYLAEDMAVAENGARIFKVIEGDRWRYYFMMADGEVRERECVSAGSEMYWNGGDGYFYICALGNGNFESGYDTALYRMDTETGETQYLWDIPRAVTNLSVCGDYLFAGYSDGHNGGLLIYSISSGELLKEDSVLQDTLKDCLEDNSSGYVHSYLIAPSRAEGGIYVLTREGLFYHVMYGTVMEQVIEGSLCSIGDVSKLFVSMCVTEDQAGGMPVFWLTYGSGEVVRFTYDAGISAVPDTLLRVYSLHNDNNVRQAVAGYQGQHPELYVQYEVGVAEDAGQTEEDALKNLATRIATGDGPDVLVMDGIPYDSYLEKGVLRELTAMYEEMRREGNFFENVTDCFYREGRIYTIPAAFQITLLMGDRELIQGADDMEAFATLLEKMETEGTSKIGLLMEDRILTAMAMISGGWVNEAGELDRETLGRFLTLCRRIYVADRAQMSGEDLEEEIRMRTAFNWVSRDGAVYDFMNGNPLYCSNTLCDSYYYHENPLFMGSMGGDVLIELNYLLSELDFMEKDYRIFSDQGTTCMPVSLLSVNQASQVPAEAEGFVRYVLGQEFQSRVVLSGIPVNRGALVAMEMTNLSHRPGIYGAIGMGNYDGTSKGEYVVLEIEWAELEDFEKLNGILDSIDRVNVHDTMIYNTVMELGSAAVNGEKSIEETVDAIEEKVRLYLAE